MKSCTRHLWLYLLLPALAGCEIYGVASRSDQLEITSITRTGTPFFETMFVFTVVNNSSLVVHFQGCPSNANVRIDRLHDGRWQEKGLFTSPCIGLYAPLTLAPGDRTALRVTLSESGTYRARFPYSFSSDPVEERPVRYLVSEPFDV